MKNPARGKHLLACAVISGCLLAACSSPVVSPATQTSPAVTTQIPRTNPKTSSAMTTPIVRASPTIPVPTARRTLDSTRIAFQLYVNNNSDIYLIKADGTGQTRLTTSAVFDGSPAWSPDGTRIAFNADSNKDGKRGVYVMNADGLDLTQLTSAGGNISPAWSPNGGLITMQSHRDGYYEIYVMKSDGLAQTPLTTTKTDSGEYYPCWSPDGTRIAYDSPLEGTYDIYTMNADGSLQTRLTKLKNLTVMHPAWSPFPP
jgi:TolB protein